MSKLYFTFALLQGIITTNKSLDREKQDSYKFSVIAKESEDSCDFAVRNSFDFTQLEEYIFSYTYIDGFYSVIHFIVDYSSTRFS